MAFCLEHPKLDRNPKFTPLSERTSNPTPFICGVPPPGMFERSYVKIEIEPRLTSRLNAHFILCLYFIYASKIYVRVHARRIPAPRADPLGISMIFCLGWHIPGGGDS